VSHACAGPAGISRTRRQEHLYLPSVLFLLTTRNRLDWRRNGARDPGVRRTAGWPGLAAGQDPDGSDQCRVGELSAARLRGHLASCLTGATLRNRDPGWLRQSIAVLSGGLPLYLTCGTIFRNLVDRGTPRPVDDFVRGLPEIVLRMMEDLTRTRRTAAGGRAARRVRRHTLRIAPSRCPLVRGSSISSSGRSSPPAPTTFTRSTNCCKPRSDCRIPPPPLRGRKKTGARYKTGSSRTGRAEWRDPDSPAWRDRRTQALAFWQFTDCTPPPTRAADSLADIIMQVQLHGAWATIDGRSASSASRGVPACRRGILAASPRTAGGRSRLRAGWLRAACRCRPGAVQLDLHDDVARLSAAASVVAYRSVNCQKASAWVRRSRQAGESGSRICAVQYATSRSCTVRQSSSDHGAVVAESCSRTRFAAVRGPSKGGRCGRDERPLEECSTADDADIGEGDSQRVPVEHAEQRGHPQQVRLVLAQVFHHPRTISGSPRTKSSTAGGSPVHEVAEMVDRDVQVQRKPPDSTAIDCRSPSGIAGSESAPVRQLAR